MNWALGPGDFLVPTLLASGPLFLPIKWWRFRLPTIGGLPECSAPRCGLESGTTSWHDAPMFPLCFLLFYVYPFPMPTFAFVLSWFICSHDPLTVPIVYQSFTHSLSPLFFVFHLCTIFIKGRLRITRFLPGSTPYVRATLPYYSQRDSASYLARLVPLVTSSRLIPDC